MFCNTPDEELFAQVRINTARDIPILTRAPVHADVAVLVGGGPSLDDTVEDIRALHEAGAHIFALNGTAAWLIARGIVPFAQIILDARRSNERFLVDATIKFYLASQCHPALFDALEGGDVVLWHANYDGQSGVVENRDTVPIAGGTVVGLRAMMLVYVLGYRALHLYGYDSSYRGGEGHAYAQPENAADKVMSCWAGGQEFFSSPWMLRQVGDFQEVAAELAHLGADIYVHGSGLLPTVAREMTKASAIDAACYDLSQAPASWDFVVWLMVAEMDRRRRGVTTPLRVGFAPGPNNGFRNDDLPMDTASRQRMLDHVMRPAMALVGAIEDEAAVGGRTFDYMLRHVSEAARRGEEVPRFAAPPEALEQVDAILAEMGISDPVVITLREASHWPSRNSNIDAWIEFADRRTKEGRSVVFVRDTEQAGAALPFPTFPKASRDLLIRAALYERAACNLFVANGPIALGYFGARPFLIFKPLIGGDYSPGAASWWAEKIGVPVGTQYPWALPGQRIVWADDTIEAIETAWTSLLEPSSDERLG